MSTLGSPPPSRMAVADFQFGDQEKIDDAEAVVIAKDKQGAAARRVKQEIAMRHVQCATVSQMNRKRRKRGRLMH